MDNRNEIEKMGCMECKAPTLVEMLQENNKKIQECLSITNEIYRVITSDCNEENDNECKQSCVMADLMFQSDNLDTLLKTLLAIKNQIL